jgi:ribonucleoside-diphosphate reductase beta chain
LKKGEIEFLSKAVVIEFIKQRFNNSLQSIGIAKLFDTDENLLKESDWFYDEVIGTKHEISLTKNQLITTRRTRVLRVMICSNNFYPLIINLLCIG